MASCAVFEIGVLYVEDGTVQSVSKETVSGNVVIAANQLIAAHRTDIRVPSFSAAVAVDGEVVWAGAVGMADIAKNVPADPDTVYRIGSTSKAVTVSATGRLLDEGLVDLDLPIFNYVEDLPRKWQALTLRQLHSHTAGIPGYENNRDRLGQIASFMLWKRYEDVSEALVQFDDAPLLFQPGTDFYYSSFDVGLASVVLQEVSGKPFMDLLQDEVLAPAGMTATHADHDAVNTESRATFYARKRKGFVPWRKVDLSSKVAAGGLVSTPSDLARLGIAYLGGAFLSQNTVDDLWMPQMLYDGSINEQSYALGWRSQKLPSAWYGEDLWIVHHGGISKGAMSWLVVYPDLDIVVALSTNARTESFADFSRASSKLVELFHAARDFPT